MAGTYQSICAQHLASKNAFIRDRLLTFSPRRHRQESRIRCKPSSLASRAIILPAHECGIPFWEPHRAANIPPAHRFPPSSKELSDARDHHTTTRESDRSASAGDADQCRRDPVWLGEVVDLFGNQFRGFDRTEDWSTDDNFRVRPPSLAPWVAKLFRYGRLEMRTPTTRNSRSAGGAATVQSRSFITGQSLHSTQQPEGEAPPRPKLDHALIEKFISPDQLSKSWACRTDRGPFFLPAQPRIGISKSGKMSVSCWPIKWFDPETNVGGVGAISLVAHVLNLSEDAAAWRLAQWIAARHGRDSDWLLAKEHANG